MPPRSSSDNQSQEPTKRTATLELASRFFQDILTQKGLHPYAYHAQRYGSAAGGGVGLAGPSNAIIAQHAFGRTQAARPLEPVLGGFSSFGFYLVGDELFNLV